MGLLDVFSTMEGQQALGLLAAAGPRADGAGFGQRLQEGLGAAENWKARQQAAKMQEFQMRQQEFQMQQAQAQMLKQQQFDALKTQYAKPAIPMSVDGYGPSQPASFDREGYGAALEAVDPMAGMQYLQSIQKQAPKLTAYKPGDSVRDAEGREVFNIPQEAKTPTSAIQEYQFAVGQGEKRSFTDWQASQRRAGASNVSVNTGQRGFDNALKLRDGFKGEPVYKAYQEVQSAYAQIGQALGKASPAGDLAGATKLMKLLDPGSVVRESELGMAMAASGAMDRIENYASNIMSGNKLTPTQRKDFQSLADSLYSESAKVYNAKQGEYKNIAERNGLNTADVVGEAAPVKSAAQPQVQQKIVSALPKTGPVGSRARDTTTGQIMVFDGMKWKPE